MHVFPPHAERAALFQMQWNVTWLSPTDVASLCLRARQSLQVLLRSFSVAPVSNAARLRPVILPNPGFRVLLMQVCAASIVAWCGVSFHVLESVPDRGFHRKKWHCLAAAAWGPTRFLWA